MFRTPSRRALFVLRKLTKLSLPLSCSLLVQSKSKIPMLAFLLQHLERVCVSFWWSGCCYSVRVHLSVLLIWVAWVLLHCSVRALERVCFPF